MYICIYLYLSVYIYICLYVCIYVYMYICLYTCISVCMSVHMYTTYICVSISKLNLMIYLHLTYLHQPRYARSIRARNSQRLDGWLSSHQLCFIRARVFISILILSTDDHSINFECIDAAWSALRESALHVHRNTFPCTNYQQTSIPAFLSCPLHRVSLGLIVKDV